MNMTPSLLVMHHNACIYITALLRTLVVVEKVHLHHITMIRCSNQACSEHTLSHNLLSVGQTMNGKKNITEEVQFEHLVT